MIFHSTVSIAVRLGEQARLSITQPLSALVSSNSEAYLAKTGLRKLGWRQLRRAVYFRISGQEKYCHLHILPAWKRGLWLYKGIPQIGDALMDLAPRSLLAHHGLSVDLYTDEHIASMFTGDPWFDKVICRPEVVRPENYDFVIVPSFKRRSLKEKISLLTKTPWISVHGFYTGPEFHRSEFAARRLSDALSDQLSSDDFFRHSRQKLRALPNGGERSGAMIKIALVLGGVDPLRTYTRWLEVAHELGAHKAVEITLLGSANGAHTARSFEQSWRGTLHNWVGKTTLLECRQIIEGQDAVIACDGGMMHLAVTTTTELISLFSQSVEPGWRLPPDKIATALQSTQGGVDAIEPGEIVKRLMCIRRTRETKAGLAFL